MKNKWITIIQNLVFLLVLSFSYTLVNAQEYGETFQSEQEQEKVKQYDLDLRLILKLAKVHFGINSISIGGGSARSIIQSVFLNKPFVFRDFDIVFSGNTQITKEAASKFGYALETAGLGRFSVENLRPRPRFNKNIHDDELAKKHNAGFGFFVISPANVEYDISVYHSEYDLSLNGIMDVDQFQIKIDELNSFLEITKNIKKFKASIIDPHQVIDKVLKNTVPAIENWGSVSTDPSMIAIRIIRTLAKFNALELDQVTKQRLKKLIVNQANTDTFQLTRNLLKLLSDKNWLAELRLLDELGLFEIQYKSFKNILVKDIQLKTFQERIYYLLYHASITDALKFLKNLRSIEPQLVNTLLIRLIEERKIKVGYFTGEFAPFHKGHEGVVNTVLEKKIVDIVFIIPTPHATNDPKTLKFSSIEWSERIAFATAGLSHLDQAWVWPNDLEQLKLNKPIGLIVSELEKFLKISKPIVHIFGMDSYHRVLYRELIDLDPRPRIVVTRPGVNIPIEHISEKVIVLENLETRPISASRILQQLATEGDSELISQPVKQLIQSTPRYVKLINERKKIRQAVIDYVKPTNDFSDKYLMWDLRQNSAGLWVEEIPEFSEYHENILEQLLELNPKEIVITIFDENDQNNKNKITWYKAIKTKFYNKVRIKTARGSEEIPSQSKIYIIHSGVVNENIKSNKNVYDFIRQSGQIIFETSDQPTSTLFENLENIRIIKFRPNKNRLCSKLFAS